MLAEPSMSRSLENVAFAVITPPHAGRQIFRSSTRSLDPRAVSDASHWVGYPAWSPDESRLAVELKEGSSTHAAVIRVSDGSVRKLTSEHGQTWVRSWSPDGKKIAAAFFRGGKWDLRWIDAINGGVGVITEAAAPNIYVRYPEWSPRGDNVVYERGELRGNVWMVRLPAKP
jgi:Tol biopolymer transport system component